MKKVSLLFIALLAVFLLLANATKSTLATYSPTEIIIIHSDGSVSPANAPIVRNGSTYVLTDDILMHLYDDGIQIDRDNIVFDGAGHTVQGFGINNAINMAGRVNVTITRFLLDNFNDGLYIVNCTQCTFSENSITVGYYSFFLEGSSNNKIYHNNIFINVDNSNSNNVWDDGYPSGGNYWDGYSSVYFDVKSGVGQNLPGSDGIGDTPFDKQMISGFGDTNVDHYPLWNKQVIANLNSTPSVSPSASTSPAASPSISPSPSESPTPSPSIPEIAPIAVFAAIVLITGILVVFSKKKKLVRVSSHLPRRARCD